MTRKSLLPVILCLVSCLFCLFVSGCESLRFAPSQAQKQTAELTHMLAKKVNEEGTSPASPVSKQLEAGTKAALAYVGRPDVPAEPEQFDTVAVQANQDALQRPDPWQMADSALELGIGICALLGGVYGTKAVKFMQQAREKSKALQEIISGNELFKQQLGEQNSEIVKAFKEAQNTAQKSSATKRLVTEMKA